uniref:Uncharacterized protein n=1 Tax=Gopherus evgoodei TaxID=1825980 RepID=A0A8C4WNB3_9SAUR
GVVKATAERLRSSILLPVLDAACRGVPLPSSLTPLGVPRLAQRFGQTHSPSAMEGEPQQPQPSPDEECAQEEDDQSHNARGIPPLSHLPISHEASGAVPHQERGVTVLV